MHILVYKIAKFVAKKWYDATINITSNNNNENNNNYININFAKFKIDAKILLEK